MKIVEPNVILETPIDRDEILRSLERYGRTCYKSEAQITMESASRFVRSLIKRGHESVLEHINITVRIICDRGISHELVRHRHASYSQESTRYCNYKDCDIAFIAPSALRVNTVPYVVWKESCQRAEHDYNTLIKCHVTPDIARSVLPNSLKTEIVMTANLREWRHFLKLRYIGTTGKPHPDMKIIAEKIYSIFITYLPEIFDSLETN